MASVVRCTSPTPYSGAGPWVTGAPSAAASCWAPRHTPRTGRAGPDRLAEQDPLVGEPAEVVVHAHRPAHHDEPRHVGHGRGRRDGVAAVDPHDRQVGARVGDGDGRRTRALERHVLHHHPGIARAHVASGDAGDPEELGAAALGQPGRLA